MAPKHVVESAFTDNCKKLLDDIVKELEASHGLKATASVGEIDSHHVRFEIDDVIVSAVIWHTQWTRFGKATPYPKIEVMGKRSQSFAPSFSYERVDDVMVNSLKNPVNVKKVAAKIAKSYSELRESDARDRENNRLAKEAIRLAKSINAAAGFDLVKPKRTSGYREPFSYRLAIAIRRDLDDEAIRTLAIQIARDGLTEFFEGQTEEIERCEKFGMGY